MASLRTLTTASRLFSMSLRRLTAHPFSTGHPFINGDHTQKLLLREADKVTGKAYDLKLVNDSFYRIRLEMPGLSSKNKHIVSEGEVKSQLEYGYREIINGMINGCSSLCEMDQFESELEDGVLWITLPLTEDAKRVRKIQRQLLETREIGSLI